MTSTFRRNYIRTLRIGGLITVFCLILFVGLQAGVHDYGFMDIIAPSPYPSL